MPKANSDSRFEAEKKIQALKSYLAKHPSLAMTIVGALGYAATHAYFQGMAKCLGVPFGFRLGPDGYVAAFLDFAMFASSVCAGIFMPIFLEKQSQKASDGVGFWGWIFIFSVIVFFVILWLLDDFRNWIFGLYIPLAPSLILFGIVAGLLSILSKCRKLPVLAYAFFLLPVFVYFLIYSLGYWKETERNWWRIATVGDDYYVVAGYSGGSLLVAPLVSTEDPEYVRQFQYISIDEPGLLIQSQRFNDMCRTDPDPVTIP